MFYRPAFCCSCGEKVERIEWHIWTSRRFCELCQTEHQFEEWLPRIMGGFFLLFGLSGIGSLLNEPAPDLVSDPVAAARARTPTSRPGPDRVRVYESDATTAGRSDTRQIAGAGPRAEPTVERAKLAAQEDEPVYLCGAETKKGTPCTRRVKKGVRCWQHVGRESMLEKEPGEGKAATEERAGETETQH